MAEVYRAKEAALTINCASDETLFRAQAGRVKYVLTKQLY